MYPPIFCVKAGSHGRKDQPLFSGSLPGPLEYAKTLFRQIQVWRPHTVLSVKIWSRPNFPIRNNQRKTGSIPRNLIRSTKQLTLAGSVPMVDTGAKTKERALSPNGKKQIPRRTRLLCGSNSLGDHPEGGAGVKPGKKRSFWPKTGTPFSRSSGLFLPNIAP